MFTYLTADPHGDFRKIMRFLNANHNSIIVILGDAGLNYYLDSRDFYKKAGLSEALTTSNSFCFLVHGNHEERPQKLGQTFITDFLGAPVYYEKVFPKILYAIDGYEYDFPEGSATVIGGAYSVDKEYRLMRGWAHFSSELPDEAEKETIRARIRANGYTADFMLTHTCPRKYEPVEWFLSGLDQSSIDKSMEDFLDFFEERMNYKKWYCGHYHGEKTIDKIKFIYDSFVRLGG